MSPEPAPGEAAGRPEVLGMFPLGMVLLPHMPLPLRVFEPRYRTLMADVATRAQPEFGVVLIERGHEVGGGDERFNVGTVARVVRAGGGLGALTVTAVGTRRLTVEEWLGEEPYPQARVRYRPELEWDDGAADLMPLAELEVRSALDLAAEVGQRAWPPGVELSDDPLVAVWQLAAVAPIGPLDHLELLGATSASGLLEGLRGATTAARELLALRRPGEGDPG